MRYPKCLSLFLSFCLLVQTAGFFYPLAAEENGANRPGDPLAEDRVTVGPLQNQGGAASVLPAVQSEEDAAQPEFTTAESGTEQAGTDQQADEDIENIEEGGPQEDETVQPDDPTLGEGEEAGQKEEWLEEPTDDPALTATKEKITIHKGESYIFYNINSRYARTLNSDASKAEGKRCLTMWRITTMVRYGVKNSTGRPV
ncbi:hypothetical protein [Brevibacillus marinus]|uniref:hypothetical protein n=1 Tax=Brevibacillus marinus TaxID=2496837 RepID=UPI000F81602B|nr:hypothetical protein [Brevibacillus marinus]